MASEEMIDSLKDLINQVVDDYRDWGSEAFPWFRGEPSGEDVQPLKPRLYRKNYNENRLLQQFRVKAPALGLGNTPPLERTDQWLFLAQHVGLPTRLLDWSEGLLIALYFAIQEDNPVLWMLDPFKLNKLSYQGEMSPNAYGLTWLNKPGVPATKLDIFNLLDPRERMRKVNAYEEEYTKETLDNTNINAAWGLDRGGTEYPVSILPTYVHSRMSAQKSRFTIWGKDKNQLNKMKNINTNILKMYSINPNNRKEIKADLRMMGITPTSVFADLDNLAIELSDLFS